MNAPREYLMNGEPNEDHTWGKLNAEVIPIASNPFSGGIHLREVLPQPEIRRRIEGHIQQTSKMIHNSQDWDQMDYADNGVTLLDQLLDKIMTEIGAKA